MEGEASDETIETAADDCGGAADQEGLQTPAAGGGQDEGDDQEQREKGRKVWKKIGRPKKEVPPEQETAVFSESPKRRRQHRPKTVENIINKALDKPIATPAGVALLDSRGKIITELDLREMASAVLRNFGGYEGLGKLIRVQHDAAKPGSPTRTKTLELVTKLIARGAEKDDDNDLSKKSADDLGRRAAVLFQVVKRLGGEQLLLQTLGEIADGGK